MRGYHRLAIHPVSSVVIHCPWTLPAGEALHPALHDGHGRALSYRRLFRLPLRLPRRVNFSHWLWVSIQAHGDGERVHRTVLDRDPGSGDHLRTTHPGFLSGPLWHREREISVEEYPLRHP